MHGGLDTVCCLSCPADAGGPPAPATPDRELELPLAANLSFAVTLSPEELMQAVVQQLEVGGGDGAGGNTPGRAVNSWCRSRAHDHVASCLLCVVAVGQQRRQLRGIWNRGGRSCPGLTHVGGGWRRAVPPRWVIKWHDRASDAHLAVFDTLPVSFVAP